MRTDVSLLKEVRQRHQANMLKRLRGGKSGIFTEHLSVGRTQIHLPIFTKVEVSNSVYA